MNKTLVALAVLVLTAPAAVAQPLGTAFTYQGRLTDGGVPAAGTFDFRFILYDAPVGGSQVGPLLDRDDVAVAEGLFTLPLDFGAGAFAGAGRWLDVSVRPGASSGAHTPIGPRQELSPAPSATFSARTPWSGISGKPAGFADDNDDDTLAGLTCANGQVAKWGGASWFCSADEGTVYAAGAGLQLVSNVFSLAAEGVSQIHLASNAVVESKLASASVTGPKLANGAVDSAKLADLSVTTNKIGVGAVTTAQIAQGTIAFADLGQNGCALDQVIKHNGAVWACAADVDSGGDITGVTAGTGLTGGATSGTASLAVVFGGSGAAGTVSRSDHGHASTYAPLAHDHAGSAWTTSASPGLQVVTSGASGLAGRTDGVADGSRGVLGTASGTTGAVYGVHGRSFSTLGAGVFGESAATAGIGVLGRGRYGVGGETTASTGTGTYGLATSTSGSAIGVQGVTSAPQGFAVYAAASSGTGDAIGVFARSSATAGTGVYGSAIATSGVNFGVFGRTSSSSGYAGWFAGNVEVTGILSRPAEELKIDHPLDPENRYLAHAAVASSDMKNVYDGVVVTDATGHGVVLLPEWFEALNRDFRYQLTVLAEGDDAAFVQAMVVRKIAGGRFTVRTSAPHAEVSWQVTGIRQDRFAQRHRTAVEKDKRPEDRGTYLHPEAWDQPRSKGLAARHEPAHTHQPAHKEE